jgi:rod shape-determining protein MreC
MSASQHKISDYFNTYGRIDSLLRENAELKIKADNYDALNAEAQQLRKLTKFHVERKVRGVVMSTKIFFYNEHEGFAVIEDANNIKPGQVVVSSNGLIGKVESVRDNVGKVMLITNSNLHVSAILGKAGIKAILSGGYNGKLVSSLINGQVMPEKGEIVITSGDDDVFPSGIVIGNVTRVSWDTVEITPSASIANTSIVSVIDRR